MICNFFKFTKRNNSTKLPNMADAKAVSIQIKDDCSFITPTIKVTQDIVSGAFSPDAFNYCYIPYWNRFYYITDWTYKGNVWEASLAVDVLASFRGEIGNTTAYIKRCSSMSDGKITDTFYPAISEPDITSVAVSPSMSDVNLSGGSIVLGVMTADQFRIGAVTYYIVTPAQLSSFMAYILSDSIYNASSVYDISSGLYKSMFNPIQYIVSCIWYPFVLNSNAPTTIHLGYWNTGVSCKAMEEIEYITRATATIPAHPQNSRGTYLNFAPYTRLTLYYPPFGSIPIDPAYTGKGNIMNILLSTDLITGQGNLRVSMGTNTTTDNNIVAERDGQIGVPIQLSQIVSDYMGMSNSMSTVFGAAASLNIGGIFSGIMSAVEGSYPKVTSLGNNGSFLMLSLSSKLLVEHFRLVDENNSEFGRPLCKNKQISTIPGYIQTGEADHQFSGTKSETADINRYLQEGFYYE